MALARAREGTTDAAHPDRLSASPLGSSHSLPWHPRRDHFYIAIHYHYDYLRVVIGGFALVVCICNAIREKDLRETVRSGGGNNTCSAYASMGRRTRCGQCIPFAQSIIKSELATA